jgi:hypothetical protein
MTRAMIAGASLVLLLAAAGCGDDDADALGVGASCAFGDNCGAGQTCLLDFKGGYCGLEGCNANAACPENAACVTHNGKDYCFRTCFDKVDCNANRPADQEANCSSSVTFISGKKEGKVCLPPSK